MRSSAHGRGAFVLGLTALTLACGGPVQEDAQDSGPLDREVDSLVCQELLDCVGASNPDALPELEAEYGLTGGCWQRGDDAACDQACAERHEILQDLYPREPSCGPVELCPEAQTWVFDNPVGDCWLPDGDIQMNCTQSGDRWAFTLTHHTGRLLFDCQGAGLGLYFTCEESPYWDATVIEGEFNDEMRAVDGTYTFLDGSCDVSGDMRLSAK